MPLIFGAYSQLPPGTPVSMLERSLTQVYKPLLTYLYQHPDIRMHLFLPPHMLQWFEQNYPEINMLIADLCKKEQVEMLTGGFFLPLLHQLPTKDRSSQIEQTTTFIRKRYGKRARTIWLYNQVWSPALVATLDVCMVDRLIISGYAQGLQRTVAKEPYVMQEMGKTLEIFFSDDRIAALVADLGMGRIDWKDVVHTLFSLPKDPSLTRRTVMVNLDQLLAAYSIAVSNPPVLDMLVLFIDFLRSHWDTTMELLSFVEKGKIEKKGYLEAGWYGRDSFVTDVTSSNEMLVRYEELNHLYGRLMYVCELAKLFRKKGEEKKHLEELLCKAQNGGVYVFDVTGGCYRSNYRKQVYRAMNEAQRLLCTTDQSRYPREIDIDFDGKKELIWMGKNIMVVLDTKGGSLSEINYLVTGWNYGDTFSGYAHECQHLGTMPMRDGIFQRSFSDVLLPIDTQPQAYAKYIPQQTFDAGSYEYHLAIQDRSRNEITASRLFTDLPFCLGTLEIEKRYWLRTHTIVVQFTVRNRGKHRAKGLFGSELNLSLGTRDGRLAPCYTIEKNHNRSLGEGKVVVEQVKNVRIADQANKTLLTYASDARFTLHKEEVCVQLATVMGMEVLYLYTHVLPLWTIDLVPGESASWTIGLRMERRSRTNSE